MTEYAMASNTSQMQNILLVANEAGSTNKVPMLMSMDGYSNWKSRFKIWINGQDSRMWSVIKNGYKFPNGEGGRPLTAETLSVDERKEYEVETKAYAHLSSALPQDIYHQFKVNVTSKSLWEALESINEGNSTYRAKKGKTLRGEFDRFVHMPNENLASMIERYFHLLTELMNHDIVIPASEKVHVLADALPERWESLILILRSTGALDRYDINQFVATLKEHELDHENKQKRLSLIQQPALYHSSAPTTSQTHAPLQTTFVSSNSYIPPQPELSGGFSGGSSSYQQSHSNIPESNAAKFRTGNLKNVSAAQVEEDMALLSTVVKSYDNLWKGRIGNNNLAGEDLEQLDKDEMDRIDIMWQMANAVRRGKEYVRRTGNDLHGGKDTKLGFDMSAVRCYNCDELGHFARTCKKPRRTGYKNPFPNQNKTRDMVSTETNRSDSAKESTTRALAVIHPDEGCDWSQLIDNQLYNPEANVATASKIDEDSDYGSDSEDAVVFSVPVQKMVAEETKIEDSVNVINEIQEKVLVPGPMSAEFLDELIKRAEDLVLSLKAKQLEARCSDAFYVMTESDAE